MARTRRRSHAAAALLAALLLAASALSGCAPGALDDSAPAEVALRSIRLAGFDQAAAGKDGSLAWATLELPGLDSAADLEIAWQTAIASLAVAYPRAEEYRVWLSRDRYALLRVDTPGPESRTAAENDDARALKKAATFTYGANEGRWPDPPAGGTSMPAGLTPRFLDAKNAAASILDTTTIGWGGVSSEWVRPETAAALRNAVAGKPAIAPAQALQTYTERILSMLGGSVGGEVGVKTRIDDILAAAAAGSNPAAAVAELRTIAIVIEAVTHEGPYGSVLRQVVDAAIEISRAPLAEGAPSDAVLVAAGSPDAPAEAREVERFERIPGLDLSVDDPGQTVVGRTLAETGGAWSPSGGTDGAQLAQLFAPGPWEAYRRADGVVFWRSTTEPDYAITDGSTYGWAFSHASVAVVNPADVGEILGRMDSTQPLDLRGGA